MATTQKKINDFLAGLPMTIVAGVFLLLDLVPHLMEEFGGTSVHLSILPFAPSWVTIIISGIPLLYLAIWRIIYNRGIAKISSALLICIAMFAALAIGELFAAGEVAFIMALVAVVQLLLIYFGGTLFRTAGLTLSELRTVLLIAFLVVPADAIRKLVLRLAGRKGTL